ncbi:TetR/AcrR family transcriptional regulator [Variovorax terrae]|uniref:TetR/AcrR family transcriptional regulator n=1 Tax=Variovorax terrae TaxID=2923278 RepID=A0A9X2APT1_9BURK|nr:TetR/AcrR family transcriptional regulator [Variovorax terrae]MCJ0762381.1 TetR/AcrR family transcriptional regulator [Variovorax terrae]
MSTAPARAARTPAAKPLKRPSQARARFTVQAIYDAFVRIWQRDGWERLTTRAVALETGISVGTLYDYFPNKTALLSGYVRHSVDVLLAEIERQAVQPAGLAWPQRVRTLVRLACGVEAPELPWFHPGMLTLEAQIAEPKHHRRVHEELLAAWGRVLDACTDLPARPSRDTLQALHLAVWGGRRYALLVGLQAQEAGRWAAQMERCCLAALQAPEDPALRIIAA